MQVDNYKLEMQEKETVVQNMDWEVCIYFS